MTDDIRDRLTDSIAEQIRRELATRKLLKSRGRIAKMKAKRNGDLDRMPLTGRAALNAIRNRQWE